MPAVTEHGEQKAVCDYLNTAYPQVLFFSVPNGASLSSPRQMSKLKSEGLLPGVCDLIIFEHHGGYAGMFLEMKRLIGGVVSENQAWFLAEVERRHGYGVVAAGFEEARDFVDEYLSWPKTVFGVSTNETPLPFEGNIVSVDVGNKHTTLITG